MEKPDPSGQKMPTYESNPVEGNPWAFNKGSGKSPPKHADTVKGKGSKEGMGFPFKQGLGIKLPIQYCRYTYSTVPPIP